MAERGSELSESPSPLGAVLTARFDHGQQALPRLLRELDGAGVTVQAADVSVPTLDDVFLSLTGPQPSRRRGGGGMIEERERSELTPPRAASNSLAADTRSVFVREMSLILRDPFSLIFSIVQPLVFLALFGPLLAGSIDPSAIGGASPLQWFLPGVIVMICLFGTSTAGSKLLFEISLGSYERVLASPIHRSSILIGRSLKELAPLVVQAT